IRQFYASLPYHPIANVVFYVRYMSVLCIIALPPNSSHCVLRQVYVSIHQFYASMPYHPIAHTVFYARPGIRQFYASLPYHPIAHTVFYARYTSVLCINALPPNSSHCVLCQLTLCSMSGIRQFYALVPYHPIAHAVFEEKTKALVHLLSSVSFQQCLIFSNLQTRAQTLADVLNGKGWPTACIAGCLDQRDRNHAMAKLKTYKCRILISTDLTSRGIDADKVNLVVNLDVPKDHETYLHRIGRAGRFGSFGIAVTLVSDGQEQLSLDSIQKRCNTQVLPLPGIL
ncbi:hypothetical protein DPMN_121655, partial [Dreissena polymorpha]